jgi:hypothetical protein
VLKNPVSTTVISYLGGPRFESPCEVGTNRTADLPAVGGRGRGGVSSRAITARGYRFARDVTSC